MLIFLCVRICCLHQIFFVTCRFTCQISFATCQPQYQCETHFVITKFFFKKICSIVLEILSCVNCHGRSSSHVKYVCWSFSTCYPRIVPLHYVWLQHLDLDTYFVNWWISYNMKLFMLFLSSGVLLANVMRHFALDICHIDLELLPHVITLSSCHVSLAQSDMWQV